MPDADDEDDEWLRRVLALVDDQREDEMADALSLLHALTADLEAMAQNPETDPDERDAENATDAQDEQPVSTTPDRDDSTE